MLLLILSASSLFCASLTPENRENYKQHVARVHDIYTTIAHNIGQQLKNNNIVKAQLYERTICHMQSCVNKKYHILMNQYRTTRWDLIEEHPLFTFDDIVALPRAFTYFEISVDTPIGVFDIAAGIAKSTVFLMDYVKPLKGKDSHTYQLSFYELDGNETKPIALNADDLIKLWNTYSTKTQIMF